MATTGPSSASFPDFLSLRRFSSSDYLQMVEAGVLGPEDHVELIGGMIVEMSPAGIPHNHFLIRLIEIFALLVGSYQLSVQGTLRVSDGNIFDPDFMLLKYRPDGYKENLPTAEDVVLIIEAAETSLKKDVTHKLPIYAAAGITDYWIADLKEEVLLVHRDPHQSTYRSVETLQKDASVSPLAVPEFSVELLQAFN